MPPHANSRTQSSSSPPPTLLSLPGELRNLIYTHIAHASLPSINIADHRIRHKLLLSTTTTTTTSEYVSALRNRAHKPLLTCFPGIAYANKQLYTELMPLFVQKTRFIIQCGPDVDYLSACLREMAVITGVTPCIERLVFPAFSFSVEYSRPRETEVAFIHSCLGLKELSITLHSSTLHPFTSTPPTRLRHPDHSFGPPLLPRKVVDIERAAGAWGLSILQRLDNLEKFQMECHVGPEQGYALRAFRQLAEWVGEHLEFAVVRDGRVREGVKGVRKHDVQFSGARGVIDFVVFGFAVERK